MSRQFMPSFITLLMLLCFTGCKSGDQPKRQNVVPASGTLTIESMDVSGLNLSFVPVDTTLTNAWSRVGENGQFKVSTYEEGDGATPGEYVVFISGGVGVMPDEDSRLGKIPQKYRSQADSPWRVVVADDARSNVFQLAVE
jgi:hypothetical protein